MCVFRCPGWLKLLKQTEQARGLSTVADTEHCEAQSSLSSVMSDSELCDERCCSSIVGRESDVPQSSTSACVFMCSVEVLAGGSDSLFSSSSSFFTACNVNDDPSA